MNRSYSLLIIGFLVCLSVCLVWYAGEANQGNGIGWANRIQSLFNGFCDGTAGMTDIWEPRIGAYRLNSTTVIFPGDPVSHARHLRRGWSRPEPEAAWTQDRIARCIFEVSQPEPLVCRITARSLPGLTPPQSLSILIQETILLETVLGDTLQTISFEIPTDRLVSGWNLMSLEVSRLDRPSALGLGSDGRLLGALIREIRFMPKTKSTEITARSLSDDDREPDRIPPGSSVIIPVAAPDGTCAALEFINREPERPTGVEIWFQQDGTDGRDGLNQKLWSRTITRPRHWRRTIHAPVSEPGILRIINRGESDLVVRGRMSVHSQPESPVSGSGTAFRSHWIVMVMDACEASFLGGYGAPDAVTPFLDRLAERGVQFRHAVGTASYTVTSVAGMLTGELPGVHGVRGIGDILNRTVPTLPEILSETGMDTLALSAMPTVSRDWGFDRGFRVFREVFAETDRPVMAGMMADAAAQLSVRPDFPTFLYVHFREPHAPYHPEAPFDRIWGQTDARFGEIAWLNEQDAGHGAVHDKEIDQARNRYKGQLAYVDRVIEHMFRRIQERIPGPLGLIVLSDHGEAFGQHQRFTHNATVYSEMLHVPFLVYTGNQGEKQIRRDRVSNAQLGEIIRKHLQEWTVKSELWHRAAGNEHYPTGLYFRNWHYVDGGYYPISELYELDRDPGETMDMATSMPAMTLFLRGRWLANQDGGTVAEGMKPETNPAESNHLTDRLRSLGYLQ